MATSVTLSTGCSSGFGHLLVEPLARSGRTVYATMRHPDGANAKPAAVLRALAAQGLDVRVLPLDVTSDAQVDAAVTRIEREAGRIDVLVNNAGRMFGG